MKKVLFLSFVSAELKVRQFQIKDIKTQQEVNSSAIKARQFVVSLFEKLFPSKSNSLTLLNSVLDILMTIH